MHKRFDVDTQHKCDDSTQAGHQQTQSRASFLKSLNEREKKKTYIFPTLYVCAQTVTVAVKCTVPVMRCKAETSTPVDVSMRFGQ